MALVRLALEGVFRGGDIACAGTCRGGHPKIHQFSKPEEELFSTALLVQARKRQLPIAR